MNQIEMLKEAYAAYAKQLKTEINPDDFDSLYSYFDAKFNPQNKKDVTTITVSQHLEGSVLKKLIDATLRTNFYQENPDGTKKPYVSLKFNSKLTERSVHPAPMAEIFVYNRDFEAVHIRYGMVSRGGIRWSDRDDYRTEVMSLVKTQQLKNSVIVPFGSKGAFLVKNPPADPSKVYANGLECYKLMISGILDITDNIVAGKTVRPANCVAYDNDDPYMVVAADKGTAKFSDTANAISKQYNFWLDDAFASGGSNGYDHKGIAITSRGSWECVKRHFRELGKNITCEEFTAAGVGAMAGDVFGNAMMLAPKMKLVAAFSAKYIFIDPAPDIEKALEERKRLFKAVADWDQYDRSLISAGGGIFEKSAEHIKVSAEMKQLLDITADDVSGADLVKAVLKAKVDLLYFGGIGTYVKDAAETDAAAKDAGNNVFRINSDEIRATVVGEGANLAMTAASRVSACLKGIRLNNDAIDNAGGVNCSDHEVNIKILLNPMVKSGAMTVEERNKLIREMQDEVVADVLKTNYQQSQAISLMERRGKDKNIVDLVRRLEKEAGLDRKENVIPDDKTLGERNLTRSEYCVLTSYTKNTVFGELLEEGFAARCPYADAIVADYFPKTLRGRYEKEIKNHYLKKEIVSMVIANGIVNRMGVTFLSSEQARTGKTASELALAFVDYVKKNHIADRFAAVEAQDYKVPADKIMAELESVSDDIKNNYLK